MRAVARYQQKQDSQRACCDDAIGVVVYSNKEEAGQTHRGRCCKEEDHNGLCLAKEKRGLLCSLSVLTPSCLCQGEKGVCCSPLSLSLSYLHACLPASLTHLVHNTAAG